MRWIFALLLLAIFCVSGAEAKPFDHNYYFTAAPHDTMLIFNDEGVGDGHAYDPGAFPPTGGTGRLTTCSSQTAASITFESFTDTTFVTAYHPSYGTLFYTQPPNAAVLVIPYRVDSLRVQNPAALGRVSSGGHYRCMGH